MFKLSYRDIKLKEKAKSDIRHIRDALKKEPIVQDEFRTYRRDISEIDNVSIKFDPNLDVSAKTVNGNIFLNAEMLNDDWENYFHYAVHEITHYLQHTSGECNGHNNENKNYLDNDSEIEAFQNQLEYREKTETKSTVNRYIEDLLDKHHVPEKQKIEKKKELLDK